MTKQEKKAIIDNLTEKINGANHFYLADISDLDAEKTTALRRLVHKNGVELVVVKNTLLRKAFENAEQNYEEFYDTLNGPTSIIFTEHGNVPAKLLKDYRKKAEKPKLKAAFVEECAYFGDKQLEVLINVKSKNELIADIIALLQSPAKNVVSALQSGGNTIAGIVKTLSEKEN